jgi:fibronectin type 3 domain-containing protein
MYVGFDAPLGTSITNTYGGTGWADPNWSVNRIVRTPLDDSSSAVVEGLSYNDGEANLETTGNAIRIAPVIPTDPNFYEGYRIQRAATNALIPAGTTWESFLLKKEAGNNGVNDCGIFTSVSQDDNGAYFGTHWSTTWRFMKGDWPTNEINLGETYFVLLRIDTVDGGDDTAYAWVNPSLTVEPDVNSAVATITRDIVVGDGAIIGANINAPVYGGGTNNCIIDEYRMGETFDDVTPCDVPKGVEASDGAFDDKVQVTWNLLDGASTYTVYRADTNDSSTATVLQSGITTNVYDDTSAVTLQIYWYWVKSDLSTGFSASDDGFRAQTGIPIAPENVQATDGAYSNKIDVTWDPSENADRYRVLRNTDNNVASATNISGQISTNFYEDTTVIPGVAYFYWIEAGSEGGWSFPSDPDRGYALYDGPVYDGYNYDLGLSVTGRAGGIGWDGDWEAIGDGFTGESIIVDGLTYETGGVTLKTEGNAAYLIPAIDQGYNYNRPLMTTLAGNNKTVWISMLVQPKLTPWDTCDLFFNPNRGADQGAFGCQWSPNFGFVNGVKSDVPGTLDETFFLVVRYDIGEGDNDTAWMWLNPGLSDEANLADANATQTRDMPLGGAVEWIINHNHTGTERGAIIFDELRIGDTWDDVAPAFQVKNVAASDGAYDDKVMVTWDVRDDVEGYTVYRNTVNDSSSATDISGELTGSSYDDTTATPGSVYFYWVKGRFTGGVESFSKSDAGYRSVAGGPAAPQNVTWDSVSGAGTYRVYRNSVNDYGNAEAVSSDLAATEYNDSDVAAGVSYYYWVRAKNATGWSNYSDPDTGYIPAQPVAYYAMDELEGTNMLDSSDNGFDGVYRDSPTLGVASADAVLFNTAVNFNVSDAVINSNSSIRDMTNNFTVALWVNPDEIVEGETRYLFAPADDGGWNVSVNGRTISFGVSGAGGIVSPADVITNGTWTHVAVTYSQLNFARMYIDGVPIMDPEKIGVPAPYVKCDTLVANGGEQELFIGSLDELHVYTGVLSDQEILLLAGIPEPGMLSSVLLALGALILRRK